MAVQQVVQSGVNFGSQVASGNTAGEVSTGGSLAGASLLAYLGPAAAAGPVGLAIAGAVAAIGMLSGKIAHLIDGCGDACVQATQIVNQAETYVLQISDAYWQAPERTASLQRYTLMQLDAIFARVVKLCGQIPGDPGRKCVQERLTRGFRPPWCTDPSVPLSQCGGWYDVTYDPIANDKGVIPDPVPVSLSAVFPSGLSVASLSGSPWLLLSGFAVTVFAIMKIRGVI